MLRRIRFEKLRHRTTGVQHCNAPEGGYTVRCSAFPGLIANGRMLEETHAAAREAL
jgi:predicted RNase H-like HicB family nuclease